LFVWLAGWALSGWYPRLALDLVSLLGMPDEVVLPVLLVSVLLVLLVLPVLLLPVPELWARANAGTSASAAATKVAWIFMQSSCVDPRGRSKAAREGAAR